MNIHRNTSIQNPMKGQTNRHINQGSNTYAFHSFKTPKSCIFKQLKIKSGVLLTIVKMVINKQKTLAFLKTYSD